MKNPSQHPASIQYQIRTNRAGYRELERVLHLLGELQNAAIRHRRILGKARVPGKEILRRQNAGLTELRANDPDFANLARRVSESVLKRVNDAYQRAFNVPGAGFPKIQSPYEFRTLEISEPAVNHVRFSKSGTAIISVKGLPELWFKSDHRIPMLEQPRSIKITKRGRTLTATLVYNVPDYPQHRHPTNPAESIQASPTGSPSSTTGWSTASSLLSTTQPEGNSSAGSIARCNAAGTARYKTAGRVG